jgi:hypothetical protein
VIAAGLEPAASKTLKPAWAGAAIPAPNRARAVFIANRRTSLEVAQSATKENRTIIGISCLKDIFWRENNAL